MSICSTCLDGTATATCPDRDVPEELDPVSLLLLAPAFRALDPSALAALTPNLSTVYLERGTTLLRQGEPGSSLYLLTDGTLQASIHLADGSETVVEQIHAPSLVGELAVLTGHDRTATVTALAPSRLVEIARPAWQHLKERCPDVIVALTTTAQSRLRQAQLVGALRPLFGPLSTDRLADVSAVLRWRQLQAGDTLFQEGDDGDSLAVVVTGRLDVVRDSDGDRRVLRQVGRGEWVGEWALLTGQPRAATVVAARDSDVTLLDRAAFDRLVATTPELLHRLARSLAGQARLADVGQPRDVGALSIALVPSSPGAPMTLVAERLAAALERIGPVLHLNAQRIRHLLDGADVARLATERPDVVALHGWLTQQEMEHAFVVYEADHQWTEWSARCVRQADRILVVGRAGDSVVPGSLEQAATAGPTRVELLLVQRDDTPRPTGTAAWLAPRTVAAHHHARPGVAEDWHRLARRLTGRARGLVLSGGGARGFAHIGVLRAAAELGITWDMVGGTSMGALIGGAFTLDQALDRLTTWVPTFASRRALLDVTLPLIALTSSRKVSALYAQFCGDARIEDLWTPFFAVSTNLSRAEPVIHEDGLLTEAIRSSTAIPGVFAPTLRVGDVLVDGGIMNNFPLDIMRQRSKGGEVVGVNVSPRREYGQRYRFAESIGGWHVLRNRLRRSDAITAPSLLENVWRATEINSVQRVSAPDFRAQADLLIEPRLQGYGSLEFDRYAELIMAGYHTGREQLPALVTMRGR